MNVAGAKLGVVVMMAISLLLAGCSGSVSPPTTTAKPLSGKVISSVHAIATPHSGPTTPARDVVNLEMFTSRSGVAVVFSPLAPMCKHDCKAGVPARYRDYLAATSDGGQTWRTTGKLPANFNPGATYALQLAFRNPDEGYVQGTDPAETLFTDNAGRTWSELRTSGWPTALSLAGSSLWIVSEFCPASLLPPDGLCPSRLLTYPLGHLTSASDTPIPTEGIRASEGISARTRAATLFDRLGPSSAVVEEGSEGSPSSLLLTIDDGKQWTILDDPCEGLVPTGLVAPSRTHWYLYCQLDGGMHQGRTALYATTDQGTNWALIAEGSPEGPNRGNIGAEMAFDLTISGNGRVLWLLGAVDGVASSTDGGRSWTGARIDTGGYGTELATAGSTCAWLPLPGYGLYRTTNGTTWARLT
jgi:photosystem II stability/assembly factor-like uncharacterized protein